MTLTANSANQRVGSVPAYSYGATGQGVTDDSAAIQRAIDSGAKEIVLPEGIVKIVEGVTIGADQSLVSTRPYSTIINVEKANGAAVTVGLDGLTGNLGAQVRGLIFNLGSQAGAIGIRVNGHRVQVHDCLFSGGAADAWAIDMVDANECVLNRIICGYNETPDFTANGIRWRNSDPATNAVNYGDSEIIQPLIRLGRADTTGIMFDGGGNGNLINNMNVYRVQVTAPESGSTPYDDTIGIHIKNSSRCRFFGGGCEAVATGVYEQGTANSGGNECQGNGYFGFYTQNCTAPYTDSNSSVARSVQQRVFLGCDFFPQITGIGDGDTAIGAGLSIPGFTTGEPQFTIRSYNGPCLITPDTTTSVENPTAGLRIEMPTTGDANPRITPSGNGGGQRLYLGHPSIRSVSYDAPLHSFARSAAPSNIDNGMIVYADGVNWNPGSGSGLYVRDDGAWWFLGGDGNT